MEPSIPLVAVMCLSLKEFPDGELAALNLALNWPGRPVPEVNIAFKRALDLHLIQPDGSVPGRPELMDAVAHVVNERVKAGTWGSHA